MKPTNESLRLAVNNVLEHLTDTVRNAAQRDVAVFCSDRTFAHNLSVRDSLYVKIDEALNELRLTGFDSVSAVNALIVRLVYTLVNHHLQAEEAVKLAEEHFKAASGTAVIEQVVSWREIADANDMELRNSKSRKRAAMKTRKLKARPMKARPIKARPMKTRKPKAKR